MKKAYALTALLALSAAVPAQSTFDAGVFCSGGPIMLYNSRTMSITTVQLRTSTTQASRGGFFANKKMYVSEWTNNGIGVYDFNVNGWDPNLSFNDTTNAIAGAPYQPSPWYDNDRAFGVYCVDGNPAPTSLNPPVLHRNTFKVDYGQPTVAGVPDGIFSDTLVPMSDWRPNPNGSGYLSCGYINSDYNVSIYDSAGQANTMTITMLTTLTMPSAFDAAMGENGDYYVLAYNGAASTPNNAVLQINLSSNTIVNTINLWAGAPTSLNTIPTGAIWMAPPEYPGNLGYICSNIDDTIYEVDFAQNPLVTLSSTPLPVASAVNTGCHLEEYQLVSWWDTGISAGGRNFHIHYPNATPGDVSYLVPSLSAPPASPLQLGPFELFFTLDQVSILGLQGVLPYTNSVFIGTGLEVDHVWTGLPSVGRLGIRAYWIGASVGAGGITDLTNVINVQI